MAFSRSHCKALTPPHARCERIIVRWRSLFRLFAFLLALLFSQPVARQSTHRKLAKIEAKNIRLVWLPGYSPTKSMEGLPTCEYMVWALLTLYTSKALGAHLRHG